MDVEGAKFVNRFGGEPVGQPRDVVLDQVRIGHEKVRSVLALDEYPVKKMLDLEPAHLVQARQFSRLGKGEVFLFFRAGGGDFLERRRSDGGQFEDRYVALAEALGEGRFIEDLAAKPGRVFHEEIIHAVSQGAVGLGHARRRGRVICREHEDGNARLALIQRIEHPQAVHRLQKEVGSLGREIGHGQRHVGQVENELQKLVIGAGRIHKGGFGEAFTQTPVFGVAIDGCHGDSGKVGPPEDAFLRGRFADATAGLETGNETVIIFFNVGHRIVVRFYVLVLVMMPHLFFVLIVNGSTSNSLGGAGISGKSGFSGGMTAVDWSMRLGAGSLSMPKGAERAR
jgi:hypothetical protein